jgi:hypothetical protein
MAKKAKSKRKSAKARTFRGTGATLDKAVTAAHDQIPGNPNIVDDLIVSKVVKFGREVGGIAGFNHFYAVVTRA